MAAVPVSGQVVGSVRSRDELRAEIDRARAEISASVADLSAEVTSRVDWREWVRRRPGLVLGGAFAVGFLIGCRE